MNASVRLLTIATLSGALLAPAVGTEPSLEKSIADKVGEIGKRITQEVEYAKGQTQKIVEGIEEKAAAISPECSASASRQSVSSTHESVSKTDTTECKSQSLSSGETGK